MKIAAFDDHRVGVVQGTEVVDVTSVLPAGLDLMPEQRINWLITHWATLQSAVQSAVQSAALQGSRQPLSKVQLLAANPHPPHVFAAPANYRKHIGELGDRVVTKKGRTAREQGFFLKAPASVVGAGAVIGLPKGSARRFDHESELAVIIGKGGETSRARAPWSMSLDMPVSSMRPCASKRMWPKKSDPCESRLRVSRRWALGSSRLTK